MTLRWNHCAHGHVVSNLNKEIITFCKDCHNPVEAILGQPAGVRCEKCFKIYLQKLRHQRELSNLIKRGVRQKEPSP
jgi:tRNA(Ile2) C34 agmatinyltransferase TiaS